MYGITCIYHKNCADGFGAALAVWDRFENVFESSFKNRIDYIGASYGSTPPDVKGKFVYIVDFSYSREVLLEMASVAEGLVIIDHHATAEKALSGLTEEAQEKNLASISTVFDMNHSGAMLTYMYFNPQIGKNSKYAPYLYQVIEDRDIWKKSLPNIDALSANLFSLPYDFIVWNEILDNLQPDTPYYKNFVKEGEAILRKQKKDIDAYLSLGVRTMRFCYGYSVPVANVPPFWCSEVGHILAEDKPFAATYYDSANGRIFSLRSRPDGVDVSEIAEYYGGGGHRHAAGFRMPLGWMGENDK
jgi:oligoribonuclease NrnB/cAMP/cGMP phosphodiesterase (DHH superfamily)